MRITIFHHSDGSFSTDGAGLDIHKGRRTRLDDGYTLQCTRSRGSLCEETFTAHLHDPLGQEQCSGNISREGIHVFDERGYSYTKATMPTREPVTA